MYFWTYFLRKTWLDKCLKSPFSADPSTSNMVNGPKHCWNLNKSTFTIFIDHCKGNSVGKSLLVIFKILGLFLEKLTLDDKYTLLNRDNLLKHLQMQLSQKQKLFLNFLVQYINRDSILNIFDWITFTVTNKYGKGAFSQISTVFSLVYHVTCRRVIWNGTF